jgi:uncharacterized protein YchJ
MMTTVEQHSSYFIRSKIPQQQTITNQHLLIKIGDKTKWVERLTNKHETDKYRRIQTLVYSPARKGSVAENCA